MVNHDAMAEARRSTTVDQDVSDDDIYESNTNEQSRTEGRINVREHPRQGKGIAETDHEL